MAIADYLLNQHSSDEELMKGHMDYLEEDPITRPPRRRSRPRIMRDCLYYGAVFMAIGFFGSAGAIGAIYLFLRFLKALV